MSDQEVIVLTDFQTDISAALTIALMNSKFQVVYSDDSRTRGVSELEQLMQQISDDGSKNLKQLITGDMFRGLLPKEPKPARKQEPYYRRFEKRKF